MKNEIRTIAFDIEIAFYPEITEMAERYGVDEKNICSGRFGPILDGSTKHITNISYKINKSKVVDLSKLKYGSLRGDDGERRILQLFSEAYNSCDESVAHYGKKFDIRFINTRMEFHGLPRLRPIKMHDTWQILKSNFILPTNKLSTAIKHFKCPYGKPDLAWTIWRLVSKGVRSAHKILTHRCRYDVLSLAWLWTNVFQKYANKTNRALARRTPYVDKDAVFNILQKELCPECITKGSLIRKGYNRSKTRTSVALKCTSCGDWASAPIKKDGTIGAVR